MPSIHAFVISWQGQQERAEHIADQVRPAVDHLTVLHSCPPEQRLPDRPGWIQAPQADFYGAKVTAALDLNRGEVMLHLHADAQTDDWAVLAHRCRDAYERVSGLGVWAPDLDYTPYPTEEVRIGSLGDQALVPVAHTDSVVWGLSAPVIARLRLLDLSVTPFGWGIDWAAICYCVSNGLLVVRDRALRLRHPRGSGYAREEAGRQMLELFRQLTPAEQVVRLLLAGHIETNRKRLGRAATGI